MTVSRRKRPDITRRRRNRNRSRNTIGTRGLTRLTEINNQPIQTRSIRYEGTSITDFDFQSVYGYRLISMGLTSTTTRYGLIEAYRLQSVSITLLPTSATNSGTFSFQWEGQRSLHTEDTLIYTPAVPSRWTFRPPEESLASYWVNAQDDNSLIGDLFHFQVDNTTVTVIMDLHFEYMLFADGTSDTWTAIAIAPSNGVFLYNIPFNGGYWNPVGVTGTN